MKVGYDQVNTSFSRENAIEMSSIVGFGANGCEGTPGLVEKNPEAVDSCPMSLMVNNDAELQLSVIARLSFMYHLEPDPSVRATRPISTASRNPVGETGDLVVVSIRRRGKAFCRSEWQSLSGDLSKTQQSCTKVKMHGSSYFCIDYVLASFLGS